MKRLLNLMLMRLNAVLCGHSFPTIFTGVLPAPKPSSRFIYFLIHVTPLVKKGNRSFRITGDDSLIIIPGH